VCRLVKFSCKGSEDRVCDAPLPCVSNVFQSYQYFVGYIFILYCCAGLLFRSDLLRIWYCMV